VAAAVEAACDATASAFRIGGDELAMVLPQTGAARARAVAESVALAVAELDLGLTVSYGVSEWPEDGPSKALLLFNSDRALYAAKPEPGERSRGRAPEPPAHARADAVGHGPRRRQLRSVTNALARAVDAKDSYTRSHSETVAQLCVLIGQDLGFHGARLEQLRLAGLLHDVGKIGITDAILQKSGPLTGEEYEVMKTHTTLGHRIVCGAELEEEAEWILHHHERPDGGGYPHALRGAEVPTESRVILVADAFEAMTSDRPYRRGRPMGDALAELERYAGTQFDSACVEGLRTALSRGGQSLFQAGPGASPGLSTLS
jgi:HD-GYP domain-containing protein (c-di-GMP phosphodiesterase class II)